MSDDFNSFPRSVTLAKKAGSLTRSKTSFATAHTKGPPANVDPWSPAAMTAATFSFISTAPMGKPFASGFATDIISGSASLIS